MLDLTPKRLKLFLLPPPEGGGGGGGGGGSSSGGGTPGTPSTGTSGLPAAENGGVLASQYILLNPVIDSATGLGYVAYYDIDDLNDFEDGCYYTFRVEDIDIHSVPTVRRVIINYLDLGPLTLTVKLGAVNDDGKALTASKTVKLGTAAASGNLLTALVDVTITGYQPQLQILRLGNGGSMCIVAVSMVGEVEGVTL